MVLQFMGFLLRAQGYIGHRILEGATRAQAEKGRLSFLFEAVRDSFN